MNCQKAEKKANMMFIFEEVGKEKGDRGINQTLLNFLSNPGR